MCIIYVCELCFGNGKNVGGIGFNIVYKVSGFIFNWFCIKIVEFKWVCRDCRIFRVCNRYIN